MANLIKFKGIKSSFIESNQMLDFFKKLFETVFMNPSFNITKIVQVFITFRAYYGTG